MLRTLTIFRYIYLQQVYKATKIEALCTVKATYEMWNKEKNSSILFLKFTHLYSMQNLSYILFIHSTYLCLFIYCDMHYKIDIHKNIAITIKKTKQHIIVKVKNVYLSCDTVLLWYNHFVIFFINLWHVLRGHIFYSNIKNANNVDKFGVLKMLEHWDEIKWKSS